MQLTSTATNKDVAFARLEPECLDYIPDQIAGWLNASIKKSPLGAMSLPEMIEAAKNDKITIYAIKLRGRLSGVFALNVTDGNGRRFLTMTAFGGENMEDWGMALRSYVYDLIHKIGATDFICFTKRPFNRLFPELVEAGVILRTRVTYQGSKS